MEAWPDELPDLMLGATVGDDDSVVRTSMDSGPSSSRNRFTAITQSVVSPMLLTGSQLVTFNTFRRTTINFGADPFTWKDPVSGDSVIFKFKKPPVWKSVKSGQSADRLWSTSLELEIQPS